MLADIIKGYNGIEVDALEVYSDMFKLGDNLIQQKNEPAGKFKANPIGYWKNDKDKKGHYRIFFDDTFEETLKEMQKADFTLVNGLTYFGRKNVQEKASKMFAMIFDLDDVTDKKLNNFLYGAFSKEEIYPLPNYIVISRSGKGIHLYYLFDEPISLFPNIKLQLKELKFALTRRMWNQYTSENENVQYQGINQGFRVIGGKSDADEIGTRAFKISDTPMTLEELNKYVPDKSQIDTEKLWEESKYSLAVAREKFPDWYQSRIINKDKTKKTWNCKDDLYYWWIREIKKGSTYGHRYFAIMCLAIYGIKCGIKKEQVEKDALELIPYLNGLNPDKPFTENDVYSALECYDQSYATFPINDISRISGIVIPKNKRNGRTQAKHLQGARAIRDINNDNWREGNGRPSKEMLVAQWRNDHPDGRKADCIRDTGLDKKTVYKWWDTELKIEKLEQLERVDQYRKALNFMQKGELKK